MCCPGNVPDRSMPLLLSFCLSLSPSSPSSPSPLSLSLPPSLIHPFLLPFSLLLSSPFSRSLLSTFTWPTSAGVALLVCRQPSRIDIKIGISYSYLSRSRTFWSLLPALFCYAVKKHVVFALQFLPGVFDVFLLNFRYTRMLIENIVIL